MPVSQFFEQRERYSPPATYAYDFGDDWDHVVIHDGLEPVDELHVYLRCASGEGRCPPEDCGGPYGYVEILLAYAHPNHEQHESMVQGRGLTSTPRPFNLAAVKFDDPRRRWKRAFCK